MKSIHVKREQVAAIVAATFPGYIGSKIQVRPSEKVTFHQLNWECGSRSEYRACSLDGQLLGDMSRFNAMHPARNGAEGQSIDLPAGAAVVEHCLFLGKDLGLRIYIRPGDMPPLLPATCELSNLEKLILTYTKCRKASYAGKDRYEQAKEDAAWDHGDGAKFGYKRGVAFPTRAEWDAAKAGLIERKLLNKAGAITNEGRNAIA